MAKNPSPSSRELMIEAGQLLNGDVEFLSKFARTVGVTRQLMSAMLAAEPTRPITAQTERKVAVALRIEAKRLRRVADRLEAIAVLMAIKKEK